MTSIKFSGRERLRITGSNQVCVQLGCWLVGLGTSDSKTTKAVAMDGRIEDDDFISIDGDTGPVAG